MTLAKAVFLNTFLRLTAFVSDIWGKGTHVSASAEAGLTAVHTADPGEESTLVPARHSHWTPLGHTSALKTAKDRGMEFTYQLLLSHMTYVGSHPRLFLSRCSLLLLACTLFSHFFCGVHSGTYVCARV